MSFLMTFAGYIYDAIFGCRHSNVTRPFTMGKDSGKETYKVCLDCGRELAYSVNTMKFVRRRPVLRPAPQYGLGLAQSARVITFKPAHREATLQDSNAAA